MSPTLIGKWMIDSERGFCPYRLLIKIDAIDKVRIAKYSKKQWVQNPYLAETVGNQIQYKGIVLYVVTKIAQNGIELFEPDEKRVIFMKRLANTIS